MSGRKLSLVVVITLTGLAGFVPSAFAQSYADRVFHNAKIVTMDAWQSSANPGSSPISSSSMPIS